MAPATTEKQPRSSQETEHRHLLSPSSTPSAVTSIIDFGSGEATPRARSPALDQSYRGFPSEAAYLEALQQWADSKKFLEPSVGLEGFYGKVTMEELGAKGKEKVGGEGEGLGLKRRWRERRERRKGEGDRGKG